MVSIKTACRTAPVRGWDDSRTVYRGHTQHTHIKNCGCKSLIPYVFLKCRRGDLNPHGTRSRQILSLLRMPISPLRPTAQLLERNTFGMNQSTGPDSSSFPAVNSRSLCQWVLFSVLTPSNCFQFHVAAPLCSRSLAQDAHSIFPSKLRYDDRADRG